LLCSLLRRSIRISTWCEVGQTDAFAADPSEPLTTWTARVRRCNLALSIRELAPSRKHQK